MPLKAQMEEEFTGVWREHMDRGIQKSGTVLGFGLGGFFQPIANASFLPPPSPP